MTPTADQERRDLSAELASASGSYRAWHPELGEGAPLVRPCVCGGEIIVGSLARKDVETGINVHNVTVGHLIWRETRDG